MDDISSLQSIAKTQHQIKTDAKQHSFSTAENKSLAHFPPLKTRQSHISDFTASQLLVVVAVNAFVCTALQRQIMRELSHTGSCIESVLSTRESLSVNAVDTCCLCLVHCGYQNAIHKNRSTSHIHLEGGPRQHGHKQHAMHRKCREIWTFQI